MSTTAQRIAILIIGVACLALSLFIGDATAKTALIAAGTGLLGWAKAAPGHGTGAAALFLLALCLPGATACSSTPDAATAAAAAAAGTKARAALHVTYSTAVHASDELAEAWHRFTVGAAVVDPAVAAKVSDGFTKVDALLAKAKPWVVDGTGDEAQAKKDLSDAVKGLLELVALFDGLGQKMPPALVDSLAFAGKALGG
jgi:hypothetical protein